MKKLFRVLSLLICLTMLTTMVPMELAGAFASEVGEEPAPVAEAPVEAPKAAENPVSSEQTTSSENNQTPVGSPAESTVEAPADPATNAAGDTGTEPTEVSSGDTSTEPSAGPSGDASAEPSTVPSGDASTEPSVNPSSDPGVAPSVDPSSDPSIEPSADPSEEPLEVTDRATVIDYAQDAGKSPAFACGFAEVLREDTPIYAGNSASDEIKAWIGKGIVYAITRTPADSGKPDRLQVAYNADPEKNIETAWVDAAALRPMDPVEGGEVSKYIAACEGVESVRSYGNDDNYPLQVIAIKFPEAAPTATPEPVTVAMSQTSAVIGVGDKGVTLGVIFSDGANVNADGTPRAVQYTSSATKYVEVNAATGALKGVRAGSATITATTEYGSASCKVTVKSAPRSIAATPTEAEIAIGETTKISPKFTRDSYGGSCTYQSGDPSIATVDANGNVTGVSKGKVIIYVYAYNLPNKPAKATVTVYGPATAINITEETVSMCTGMEHQLGVTLPEYEREGYTFSSDNDQVISVTKDGLVLARGEGSATVTVTSNVTGVTDSCALKVLLSPAEENVNLTAGSYNLGLKEKFNILDLVQVTGNCHAEFSFKSSNARYVNVDAAGNVTGMRKGSATITITTHNNIVRNVKVTVYKNPTSVAFSPKSLTLGVGMSAGTKIVFTRSGTYSQHSFASSDASVATIDPASGVITAVGAGTAVITCTPQKGKAGSCTVTVVPAPAEISVSPASLEIGFGEKNRQVVGQYPSGTMCNFTYKSEDESIVTVNDAGVITTVKPGSTNIVVTSHNGVTAKCRVDVLKAPTYLNLSVNTMKLMVGETNDSLTYSVDPGAASGITLSSSNKRYVKIVDGKLVGVKAGTAIVTAKTYNGVTDSCKVTVYRKPTSVEFSSKAVTLGKGDTAAVKVKFNKSNSYSVCTYASSNPNIATIDPNSGVITANGVGTATLTVTTQNGKKGTCVVNVLPAPETISVNPGEISVGLGEVGRSVSGQYPSGTMCSFTYKSQDESILTVDANTGAITTKKAGSTNIVVASHNGATVLCPVKILNAPTTLKLNKTSMKMMLGEINDTLTGTVDEGAASGLTFSSSNKRYVKIEDGKLVGMRAGTAIITATTYNGVKATCKVTVCRKPTSVEFSSKAVTLGKGDTATVTVKFNKSNSYSVCTYASSDPNIATIDPNTGVITANGVGTATLTVTTQNGKKATCVVSVLPAPENISVTQKEVNMGLGETGKSVSGQCPKGTMCSFTYKSQDESIAIVDEITGAITSVSAGSVDVVVTAHNGATASCRLNVKNAPATLKLNKTSMKMMVGETNDSLTGTVNEGAASGLTFSTSNKRYVKIVDGKLVGVKAGTATITAKTYNGVKATCTVKVCAAPKSVSFKNKNLTIGCGESIETAIVYNPASAYSICTYSSADESVATVDPNTGVIKGVKTGIAVITAKPLKGAAGTCTVTVCPAPTSVSLPQSAYEIAQGMSMALTPVLPAGSAGRCSFTSSNPNVVEVNADGMLKGIGGGTATITVTTYNNFSTSCTVTVTPAPASVKFNFSKITMLKGDKIQIPEPVAYDANGKECPSTYTYKSSSTRYATISGNTVKGMKTGTVTITAQSYNGKTASFKLAIASSISGLTLDPGEAELYTNGGDYVETLQLNVGIASGVMANVVYTSSDPGIASVTQDGLVTPIAPGTVTITAKAISGKTASATITVKRLSNSIALGAEAMEMGEGESYQLVPVLDEGSTAIITYTTSDANVVTVDEKGMMKAVAAGKAIITATMQGGKAASMSVNVLPGPTAIHLNMTGVSLAVGESVVLNPEFSANAENFCKKLRFASSNDGIVSISENGAIVAVAVGEAVVTATTCNGLTDSCLVRVSATAAEAQIAFEKSSYGIICGDHAKLPVLFNKAAIERGYTVTSSDESILKVDGLLATADAVKTGKVTVTLTINPVEGEEAAEPIQASCTVDVRAFAEIEMPAEVSMYANSERTLEYALTPENLIGTYSFAPEDGELISFDPETGIIRSNSKCGTTNLVFRSFNNSASCAVTVQSNPKYRALVIGSYNNSGATNDLPFAANNLNNMVSTLSRGTVGDEKYSITSAFSNPGKDKVRSLITGAFKDATAEDVSLIYIVSHGYYQSTQNGYYGYYFSLAPNYSKSDPSTYVTASELMSWISGIPGNVILVLDSCRSGGFIADCSGSIASAGNISVLTAQTADKNASYYEGTSAANTVEFLTYAFCRGLGVDQINGTLDKMNADKNGDGKVTVSEAFAYAKSDCEYQIGQKRGTFKATRSFEKWMAAKSCIKVPGAYTQAAFDAWSQSPQYRVASNAFDLVFYER